MGLGMHSKAWRARERRAKTLLLSHLTPRQRRQLQRYKAISVRGQFGQVYVVSLDEMGNFYSPRNDINYEYEYPYFVRNLFLEHLWAPIPELVARGFDPVYDFGFPNGYAGEAWFPHSRFDNLLAVKIALETDEQMALATACGEYTDFLPGFKRFPTG